jgi:DNA-binding transcriptional regulator YdaS (Cro superfamily)
MNDLADKLKELGVSYADFAKAINVNPSQVTRWIKWRMPVSEKRVDAVSAFTGIPRHELRPDLWLAPAEGEAA